MISNKNNNGSNNVIIGNRSVNGDGNVIIDATDSNGNIILNHSMIIGHNAKGGSNDIVIGAGAGCGSDLFLLLNQLEQIANNKKISRSIQELLFALDNPKKNKNTIENLWSSIEKSTAVVNVIVLTSKIASIIKSLF